MKLLLALSVIVSFSALLVKGNMDRMEKSQTKICLNLHFFSNI